MKGGHVVRRAGWAVAAIAAALIAPVAVASAVSAQIEAERVVELEVDITVHPDGSADFIEHIGYSFGEELRHGIRRVLVTAQRYDDERDRLYPLTVIDASSPDAPSDYVVEDAGGGATAIRVGDENEEITGRHNYDLAYRLGGVVNAQDGPDELYWNIITGSDWQVPIDAVSVTVNVPGGAERVACYVGPADSTLPCTESRIEGGTARFEHGYIPPGHSFTIAVAIPDTDGPRIEPRPILGPKTISDPFSFSEAFEATPLTVGGSVLLTALLGVLIARLQFHVGRDRRAVGAPVDVAFADEAALVEPVPLFARGETPVELVPPDGMRPGQLGVLRDEVANNADVAATIVDLAVRGYLRIEELPDDDGKVDDYRFVRLAKNGGLLSYEEYLLRELFATGPVVTLSSLRNKFARSLAEVKKQLYLDAVQRGWFTSRPDHVRRIWFLVGLGVTAAGVALTVVLAQNTSLGLLGLPLVVAGLALAIGARWMPARTAIGYGVYRRVQGFGEFIEHSEKHRAQWAERRHLFTEYLPYAIAFGATRQWARTLEALGAPPPEQTGWYVGRGSLGWSTFGDRMNQFTNSAASTLSSTPGGSGSSGFSGGSAGGGGGGGGVGSW
ncbi:MAG TPA: DUF2207 domain-containing protein [Acidimicrobiales bacterium]